MDFSCISACRSIEDLGCFVCLFFVFVADEYLRAFLKDTSDGQNFDRCSLVDIFLPCVLVMKHQLYTLYIDLYKYTLKAVSFGFE